MDSKAAIALLEGEITNLKDLEKEGNEILNDESNPISTLHLYERGLNEALRNTDECWGKCSLCIAKEKELDELQRNYRSVTRNVRKTLVTLQKAIANRSSSVVPTTTSLTPHPDPHLPPAPILPLPKLPALKIPSFGGSYETWNPFWDIFNSLVHSRTDIANVVKFSTLRASLTDNAFKAIEGLPVSNDNYPVAIKLLRDRYANTENLKRNLMSKLTHLDAPSHNLEDLTSFKLEYEKIILQLKGLTIDTDALSPILVNMITEKLPSETRKLIANKYDTTSLEMKEVSDGIKYVCDLIEFCQDNSYSKGKRETTQTKPASVSMNERKHESRAIAVRATAGSRFNGFNNGPHNRPSNNRSNYGSNPFSGVSHNSGSNHYSGVSHNSSSNRFSGVSHNSGSDRFSSVSHNNQCVFCSRNHASRDCRTFDSVDKRRDRIKELGLCFACLQGGHLYYDCRHKPKCRICDGPHYPMVCRRTTNSINPTSPKLVYSTSVSQTENPSNDNHCQGMHKGESTVVSSAAMSVNSSTTGNKTKSNVSTALPTATVMISGSGHRSIERALFDSGSQRTFIDSSLSKKLRLPTVSEINLNVKPFGKDPFNVDGRVVRVVVRLGRTRTIIHAVEYDHMTSNIYSPGLARIAALLSSRGVKLADKGLNSDNVTDIGLVIGVDYYSRFITGQRCCSGIDVLNSSAGALIFGNLPGEMISDSQATQVNASRIFCGKIAVTEVQVSSCCDVDRLWDMESAGINLTKESPEERETVRLFNESVVYNNHKYEVALPFKDECRPPVNYRVAIGQLKSLCRRFLVDHTLFEHYNNVLLDYVEQGFIKSLPDKAPIKGHYLPHHPVLKDSETTPIRIVFNASSKQKGELSLNDCLLTGPSLTTKLYEMLLNFRVNPVAAIADISKAFLRIGLSPDCRDYCRFLWIKNPSDLSSIVTYQFCVICFGATSSPFILQQTLLHHFSLYDHPLAASLMENFYVDNFIKCYRDTQTLFKEYPVINEILGRANMPLQEWASNDSHFNEFVSNGRKSVNVLGLDWNLENDSLSLKAVDCTYEGSLTKRKVLSIVSRLFDPLGIISPVQIQGKIFLQNLWQNSYSWDTPLSEILCKQFNSIVKCFQSVDTVVIPRNIITPAECHLHVFCDASTKAYGVAAYVVKQAEGVSYLLASKGKVAPHKKQTIPRLELTALALGARFANNLMSSRFHFIDCTIWSDSAVAICWVHNNNSKIPFVRNRVKEIRESSFPVKFIPSKDNPADLVSRSSSLNKLIEKKLWWNGPEWLVSNVIPDQKLPETVNVNGHFVNVNELMAEPRVVDPPPPVIDISKYSCLRRLKRVMKYVLILICKFTKSESPKDELKALVYMEQEQHYPNTKLYLKDRNRNGTPSDIKNFCFQLHLFIDEDGLIRSKGRVTKSSLPYDTQCPVLLPPPSHLTWLIVDQLHRTHHHCGVSTLLVLLRENFWLPKARQVIKKLVAKCVLCQIICKERLRMPPPPPLPAERVKYDRPFQCVGVDYTGAINIVDFETGIEEKVFICLFTCSATRAVHLELTRTLSASDFLLAFRRFVGHHSVPSLIISDNGRNFVGFNNFLKEIQEEREVKDYLCDQSVRWRFITPRAPWTGGFYERLIGVVKGCLCKALYRRKVSFEELRTLLVEFQAIVNMRPLTYLSQDRENEALTPSLLLYGRNIHISPPLNDLVSNDPDFVGPSELREQYARLSTAIQKFEHSWQKDYLVSLRERHYNSRSEVSQHLKEGDLVMVDLEDHLGRGHRSLLSLGRIHKLLPASDGIVRSVEVKTAGRAYIRPITKLIHLEMSQDEAVKLPTTEIGPPTPVRPKREAARRCDAARKQLVASEAI